MKLLFEDLSRSGIEVIVCLVFKHLKISDIGFFCFPFIIILVCFSVFAPNYFIGKPLMVPLFLLLNATLFWGTYHLWKYVGDKKHRDS